MTDLSTDFRLMKTKKSLKNLKLCEKWEAIESAEFQVSERFSGQSVILIDDLYQSGATIHVMASKLYAAKARRVYGLILVKSVRDSDNQWARFIESIWIHLNIQKGY